MIEREKARARTRDRDPAYGSFSIFEVSVVVSVMTAPATSATPASIRMDAPTRSVSISSTVGKSIPGISVSTM